MRWGIVRVVTTGSRRVVTTRLAQGCWGRTRVKLQQPRLSWLRCSPQCRVGESACLQFCLAGWTPGSKGLPAGAGHTCTDIDV